MLQLQSIFVTFGLKTVLQDLSCSVAPGSFVVIVGANGAGKTTLFDVIAGMVKPTRGSIILNKEDVTFLSEQQRALMIGRLFQNPLVNCVPAMSVAENIALALCKGKKAALRTGITKRVLDVIEELGQLLNLTSAELATKTMGSLSGGQRQTIALVMATLVKPKLLLLDEPTAALDPQAATTMLDFAIRYIREHGITTMMITHDPDLALSVGDIIWVLKQGRVAKIITAKEKSSAKTDDLIGHIDYEKLVNLTKP